MNYGNTVHQYIKMTLWSRRKSKRNLVGVISKQTREIKQQGVPALERVNNTIYTASIGEKVLPVVPPTKIKLSTTLNFAKPINSEYKEWFELKSVKRVNKGVILSNL